MVEYNHCITVKLSKKELSALNKAAKKYGMSRHAFARQALREKAGLPVIKGESCEIIQTKKKTC